MVKERKVRNETTSSKETEQKARPDGSPRFSRSVRGECF